MKPITINTFWNPYYYFGYSETSSELIFETYTESLDLTMKDNKIASIFFYQDDKAVDYERTYPNILNIFGDISGLFSA